MQLKLQVQGVATLKTRKGTMMPYCFGFEAAPASLRQAVQFVPPDGSSMPAAGSIVNIDVREVGENRGTLWIRGTVAANGAK